MSKNKNFSFAGPDGTKHSFQVPDFLLGSSPASGSYVGCTCGEKHTVFIDTYDHGVKLGKFLPAKLPSEHDGRTYNFFLSFRDGLVGEEFSVPSKF